MTGRILRIPMPLVRALLKRGVAIWIVSRLMAMTVFSMAASSGGSDFSPTGLMLNSWSVVMTATLVLFDIQRRKELMLFRNLGIRLSSAMLIGAVPAAIAESLLVMLAS